MNFTQITRDKLVEKPSEAPTFDNARIGGGIDDDGQIWLAIDFVPMGAGGLTTLQATPTQWLELCHALYGIAGRLLELQGQENRRRELRLDLLPKELG
jgi:hypothetical protein